MEIEQTYFRLHYRVSRFVAKALSAKVRRLLLYGGFVHVLCTIILFWILHSLYVSKTSQPNCLAKALQSSIDNFTMSNVAGTRHLSVADIDVIEIRIGGYWNQVLPELRRVIKDKYLSNTDTNATASSSLIPEWRHIIRRLIEYDESDNKNKGRNMSNFQHIIEKTENKLSYVTQLYNGASGAPLHRSRKADSTGHSSDAQHSSYQHQGKRKSNDSYRAWLAELDAASPSTSNGDMLFWYSPERGILSMNPARARSLTLRRINFSLPEAGLCMGMGATADDRARGSSYPWKGLFHRYIQREWRVFFSIVGALALDNHLGFDVPVLNSVIQAVEGEGYLFSRQSGVTYSLEQAKQFARIENDLEASLLLKFGTLFTAVFLLYSVSSLVSFLLAQTQQRMFRFTLALQGHIQHQQSLVPLLVVHSLESLVYIPIMLGVLFFLFEFFADQLLGFLVLIATWLSEFFNVASCRTLQSVSIFPKVFCLSLMSFFCYYLTYPFGFHYMALYTCFSCVVFTMFYLWHNFELPALMDRTVTLNTPRVPEVRQIMRRWPASGGLDNATIISLNVSVAPLMGRARPTATSMGRGRAGSAPQSSHSFSSDFDGNGRGSTAEGDGSTLRSPTGGTESTAGDLSMPPARARSSSQPNLMVGASPPAEQVEQNQRERSFAVSAFNDRPQMINSYFIPSAGSAGRSHVSGVGSVRNAPTWHVVSGRDNQRDSMIDRTAEICSAAEDAVASSSSSLESNPGNHRSSEQETNNSVSNQSGLRQRGRGAERLSNSRSDTSISDSVVRDLPTDYTQTRNINRRRAQTAQHPQSLSQESKAVSEASGQHTENVAGSQRRPLLANQINILRNAANSWMESIAQSMRRVTETPVPDEAGAPDEPPSAHDTQTARLQRRHPSSFDASDRAFR
eukprot:gb/GECG01016073.1/.p1 GENE.gb/GECG01016073.1/~~gb/GECG01016073.1/.p1  ORF type:complete len:909 (+),score=62.39 gb/GECG01016073.1/:1-2727(+)